VRRAAFDALNGLAPDLLLVQDVEFCLRLAKSRAGRALERFCLANGGHVMTPRDPFFEWGGRGLWAGGARFAPDRTLHPELLSTETTADFLFMQCSLAFDRAWLAFLYVCLPAIRLAGSGACRVLVGLRGCHRCRTMRWV